MREIMLARIEEIRNKEQGFRKGSMRWDNFSHGTVTKHISEIEFEKLDDTSLVFLFERLIRRYYTQM